MSSLSFVLGMMGGPAAGDQQGGGSSLVTIAIIGVMLMLLYYMMFVPQARKEKERKKMIEDIKSGERVMFGGGIIGTVTNVKDATFTVKIAENVKIEIARGAVMKVLDKDERPEVEEKK